MSQQMFVCGKAFPVKLEYLPGCCHSLICIDIAHMRKMQCEDLMQVRRGWGGNFGSRSGGIASLYSCQLDLYQTEMLGQGPTEWSLIGLFNQTAQWSFKCTSKNSLYIFCGSTHGRDPYQMSLLVSQKLAFGLYFMSRIIDVQWYDILFFHDAPHPHNDKNIS